MNDPLAQAGVALRARQEQWCLELAKVLRLCVKLKLSADEKESFS
jgi:hypothetical protein